MLQVESTFIGFIKYESTLYKIDDRTYYKLNGIVLIYHSVVC